MTQTSYFIVLKTGMTSPTIVQLNSNMSEWSKALQAEFTFVYGRSDDFKLACDLMHQKQNNPSLGGLFCGS